MASFHVTLDPPAVATDRVELDLNSGPIRIGGTNPGNTPDWGDAEISQWLADQTWGSSPVDFRVPNRTVKIPLFLGAGAFDSEPDAMLAEEAARAMLQQKVALLQREGGWLLRQRDGGPAMYADIVNATLTLPDVWGETGGIEPDVILTLECLPDFYGDEITLDTIAATGTCKAVLKESGVQAVVEGDHPGRCRIVVTDASGNDQQGALWGVRSRHYDSASTAALVIEGEAMTPLDIAATFVRAGASGGSTMRHAGLPAGSWCPVLETDLLAGGALTHTGSYRVWARVYSATGKPQLRLIWGVGDVAHPVTNDAVALPGAGAFWLVDLGQVRLDKPPAGAYAWHGVIQALGVNPSDPVEIDCVYLQPLDESAGSVSAVQAQSPLIQQPDQSFITGADSPFGVAVDSTHIYWANHGNGTIGRANLDGTGVNQNFITGASNPFAVVVDAAHVYWANAGTNAVGRANLDGSSPNNSFITGASTPAGVAVDSTHIYWANHGNGTIGRANLDGSGPNQSFITGATGPFGVAVDSAHVYWANQLAGTIGRANLDGSSPNQNFIAGASDPAGVTVDSTHVYWTNQNSNTIGRANLDGSSPNESFIIGASTPDGVAVDATHVYWANDTGDTIGRASTTSATSHDAAIYASRAAELRTDGMFRQDSTGTVEGAIAQVIGDLPRLPPSGVEDRPVELFIRPTRGDFDSEPDTGLDAFTAQLICRPTYLFRP